MIEEQVHVEGPSIDDQRYLAADKGKAAAEFQKQIAEMDQEAALQLSLRKRICQGKEVEVGARLESECPSSYDLRTTPRKGREGANKLQTHSAAAGSDMAEQILRDP
jgi:hypothetical protein